MKILWTIHFIQGNTNEKGRPLVEFLISPPSVSQVNAPVAIEFLEKLQGLFKQILKSTTEIANSPNEEKVKLEEINRSLSDLQKWLLYFQKYFNPPK